MYTQDSRGSDASDATVLVVDDERGLVDLYARWLGETYAVCAATSGAEALEKIDASIDVVLLDRRMPDLSGREVLAEIRRRGLPCRVAMVTAVDPDVDVVEMGFDDYVCKPVTEADLTTVVEALLSRRRYDDRVQDLFALESKRGVLEAELSSGELAGDDRYRALCERIEGLRVDVDERLAAFDRDDVRAVFLTLGEPPAAQSTSEDSP